MRILPCLVLLAVAALGSVSGKQPPQSFDEYVSLFQKKYVSPFSRFSSMKNYHLNMQRVEQFRYTDPTGHYGATIFADLSEDEFKHRYLSLNHEKIEQSADYQQMISGERRDSLRKQPPAASRQESSRGSEGAAWSLQSGPDVRSLPRSFDWRDKIVLSAPKAQDTCGSCWAFATTGVLESQYYMKYQELIDLSEQ